MEAGLLTEQGFAEMKTEITGEMDGAVKWAAAQAEPGPQELYTHVYAD